MRLHSVHGRILLTTVPVLLVTAALSGTWFLGQEISPENNQPRNTTESAPSATAQEKNIVIHLDSMTLEIRDGETVLQTLPVLSQGKPGSYYETIGGTYTNDYKTPLHFSSIGHVYMPYSVHLFGNYFIHGVPYYPNGETVSSAYSGGCIRLTNENAKIVYDLVDKGTKITVTRNDDFTPTIKTDIVMTSEEMTTLMVASISLETLTQDNEITDTDGSTPTTRKKLLTRLVLEGDKNVAHLYANERGEENFVNLMNEKAEALGLSNTHFTDVTSPVTTSYDDYVRFMTYITTYKSYLRTMKVSSNQ